MSSEVILVDSQEEKEPFLEIPLGLLSIGTVLKKNHYKPIIVKINKDNPEKIEEYIDKDTLCIGFGVKTDQVETALLISKHIKKNFGNRIKIIWGGVHVNLYPKQVLENENIDIVVIGDGEYTMLDVMVALRKNKQMKNIAGLGYKTNKKMIFNKRRGFTDISKLPRTDYSIISEIEKYIEGSKCADAIMVNVPFFPVLSGVGCPYNCSFCYNTSQRGRISKREVGLMLDDIEYLKEKYSLNFFRIRDELFFYDKRIAEEFLKEKRKRGLKFQWDTSFHINLLKNENFYSDSFLEKLKKEGFVYTGVGVESGSIEQLKRYRKNITPEDVLKVVKRMKRLKILSTYAFMVGAPHETYDNMIDTVKLIYKIKSISPHYAYITGPLSLFRPYPGADLYQEAIKLGYKEKNKLEEWKNLSKFTGYSTYRDFTYLNADISRIFNLFYYLKFIKGLFNVKKNGFINFLHKPSVYNFMTSKPVITFIGSSFRIFVENKFIDGHVIRPIIGRSLILEK